MKVIVAKPNQKAYIQDIKGDLHELQELVKGYMETVPFAVNGQNFIVFCNEEGLLHDFPPNRRISGNLIHGNFVVTGYDGGSEIKGLTDEEISLILSELNN